jgi:hypothetical protein
LTKEAPFRPAPALAQARHSVGYRHLILEPASSTVRFAREGIERRSRVGSQRLRDRQRDRNPRAPRHHRRPPSRRYELDPCRRSAARCDCLACGMALCRTAVARLRPAQRRAVRVRRPWKSVLRSTVVSTAMSWIRGAGGLPSARYRRRVGSRVARMRCPVHCAPRSWSRWLPALRVRFPGYDGTVAEGGSGDLHPVAGAPAAGPPPADISSIGTILRTRRNGNASVRFASGAAAGHALDLNAVHDDSVRLAVCDLSHHQWSHTSERCWKRCSARMPDVLGAPARHRFHRAPNRTTVVHVEPIVDILDF